MQQQDNRQTSKAATTAATARKTTPVLTKLLHLLCHPREFQRRVVQRHVAAAYGGIGLHCRLLLFGDGLAHQHTPVLRSLPLPPLLLQPRRLLGRLSVSQR